MVHGVGTDILNIKTIASSVADIQDPFVQKIYTKKELELIQSRDLPIYCFATRFAGKEAVFKSLGVHGDSVRLNEIEILETLFGQPQVTLYGNTKRIVEHMQIHTILISLSYDTDYAVAFATALRAD